MISESLESSNKLLQEKKKPIAKGFFNIRSANGTCTLNLKGDFTSKNINVISWAMIMSGSSHRKFIEIDLGAVNTMDM